MVMALYAIAELIRSQGSGPGPKRYQGLAGTGARRGFGTGHQRAWTATPVASVAIGATVRIKPGERVPLDGKVTKGNGAINQAP